MANVLSELLDTAELHRLGRLALMSRYVVEGNLAGVHRSPQRGASTEFADHRAYIAGDDPKHLDWKVLGRTDRYFIRRYEDETNLRVYLAVDRSASMGYGSGRVTKYAFASRLAAALGYVVVSARDSVGLFLHADRIDVQLEAGHTVRHLDRLLREVVDRKPASTTAIAGSLHRIADSVRRRALVVILSDLFEDPPAVLKALAHFRRQHHDVIVFHVLDAAEMDFPFRRGARFEDLETNETIAVDPAALRGAYLAAFREFIGAYREAAAAMRIDYRIARTDQPVEPFVRAYLEERRRLAR